MDDKKIILGSENALAAFNRIKQKHGFRNIGELVAQGAEGNLKKENFDVEKIQEVMDRPVPLEQILTKEVVNADRVFDILRFIDEQNFSNNIKAALGIILSGERSEIGKAIEYLEKEV